MKRRKKSHILKIVTNAGVDVFIDNTGQPAVIEMGYEITKQQGRVIVVKRWSTSQREKHQYLFITLHFGKSIGGSHGGETIPHVDIPRYHNLFDVGMYSIARAYYRYFRPR